MQLINVTVEISDGIDPQAAVTAINAYTNVDGGDREANVYGRNLYVGSVETGDGDPGHAVEGEPYRAPRPATRQELYVGKVSLVTSDNVDPATVA